MFSARPLEEPSSKRTVAEDGYGKPDDPKVPSSPGKRKAKSEDDIDNNSSSDDDDDEREEEDLQDSGSGGGVSNDDPSTHHKRSRRLAMNRASARARRKRKKVLLDSLATQVTELTKQNQVLEQSSQTLQSRAHQLETALAQAQATITQLLMNSKAQPLPAASAPPTSLLGNVPTASALPASRSSLVGESLRALLGQQQQQEQQAVTIDSLLAAATAPGGTGARKLPQSFVDISTAQQREQHKMLEAQLIMAAIERSKLQGSNASAPP